MVTSPSPEPRDGDVAYRHPELAGSFGADADRYDRARPRYPAALVDAVAERLPGPEILDVGMGTGIAAEPFRERGFTVLGVEVDPQMASLARAKGFEVEEARFEEWDPAGRAFDGVIAGQTWHWIDPTAGAVNAARALRPGGRLAMFWNLGLPDPEIAARFADIFASLGTGLPFNPWAVGAATDPYGAIIERAAVALRGTGVFGDVERLSFSWRSTLVRDAWLEQVSTAGGINRLPADTLATLLRRMGEEIDERGGAIEIGWTTVAAITERRTG